MWFLICFGLLAAGAVFAEEEQLDFSGMSTRVQIENLIKWRPPHPEGENRAIDSSEHGVTPGPRLTNCLCGWANRKAAGRIIGGKIHGPNEYPFIAGVAHGHQPTQPHCGSIIISPWHIITAAHCTAGARSLAVTLGDYNRSGKTKSEFIRVRQIIDHEGFHPVLLFNDISLLLLEKPIKQTQLVGPACLPTGPLNLVGKHVRIIGWGAMMFNGPMVSLPQKVDVQVIDMYTCNRAWPFHVVPNPATQICTHSRGKTACQGDSGGPVVWLDPETNRYTVVGLVSFGPHCKDDKPSIQTSVSAHLAWIKSKIQQTAPGQMTCSKV